VFGSKRFVKLLCEFLRCTFGIRVLESCLHDSTFPLANSSIIDLQSKWQTIKNYVKQYVGVILMKQLLDKW